MPITIYKKESRYVVIIDYDIANYVNGADGLLMLQ